MVYVGKVHRQFAVSLKFTLNHLLALMIDKDFQVGLHETAIKIWKTYLWRTKNQNKIRYTLNTDKPNRGS